MAEATSNLERRLDGTPIDDSETNLRAYFASLPEDHLRLYRADWSDDEVMAWDGNFRDDGALMIVCCYRDLEVDEYREVLEDHLKQRGITK